MRLRPTLALLLLLAGCAIGTGILPVGPNTYTVREEYAPIRGGATAAEQAALTEANAFCVTQGRLFLDMATPPRWNPWGPTGYSVTFRCALAGDPALAQGGSVRAPDQIIEQRQR
jgi:hypothetical protein